MGGIRVELPTKTIIFQTMINSPGSASRRPVGANKAAAAIIGERTEFYSQAPGPKRGLPGLAGPFKRFVLGEPWCFLMFFWGTSLVQW